MDNEIETAEPIGAIEAVQAPATTSTRRGMLRFAGAAAAGAAAVAVVGNAKPAAAATGGPMLIGQVNTADAITDNTLLLGGSFGVTANSGTSSVFGGRNGAVSGFNTSVAADGTVRAGVLGVASPFLSPGVSAAHGVHGLATGTGAGAYGESTGGTAGVSPGVLAKSTAGPAVQLVPVATGAPTTGTWTVGAIQPDTTGRLFYCTVSGTPGTWVELTAKAPALTIISPVRVYDSRSAAPTPGKLPSGGNRVVSVKDSRDPNTGAVLVADVVPVGATAIVGNLTITGTTGNGGFLSVVPGDAAAASGSSINWFGPNQNLANGITAKLDANRQLKVFGGGGNETDFIIDISGYYL